MGRVESVLIFTCVLAALATGAFWGWGFVAETYLLPTPVYDENGTLITGEDLVYESEYVQENNAKRARAFQIAFFGIMAVIALVALYVTSVILEHVRMRKNTSAFTSREKKL